MSGQCAAVITSYSIHYTKLYDGTAYRKTPVFSARMTHLIFAPYWNVPPTILREDKLPRIKADPSYVQRHHFEISYNFV